MPYCYCYFVIFISFCLPVCLVAGLFGKGRTRSIILGVAATAAFIAVLITTGPAAGHLLKGQDSIARVSLGTGFWLAAGGAYIVIFSARQGLIGQPIWRYLVSFSSTAGKNASSRSYAGMFSSSQGVSVWVPFLVCCSEYGQRGAAVRKAPFSLLQI